MNGDYRSARLRLRERGKITLTFITHTPVQGKRSSLSLALNSPIWLFPRWLQIIHDTHSDTLIPVHHTPSSRVRVLHTCTVSEFRNPCLLIKIKNIPLLRYLVDALAPPVPFTSRCPAVDLHTLSQRGLQAFPCNRQPSAVDPLDPACLVHHQSLQSLERVH
jgi:hypothetical protein